MFDFNANYPTQSEIERAKAQAVGGIKDRCVKGKSCSAACITSGYACLVELPSSPSEALRQIREEIAKEPKPPYQQLPLFDVSKSLSKEGIEKARDRFKAETEDKIQESLKLWSRYNSHSTLKAKEKYEEARQEAIEYNKKMVREGLADKAELLKVPAPWEKVSKTLDTYERAMDGIWSRAEDAAAIGDKGRFLKEVRKYDRIHEKLGTRLGRDKDDTEEIWENMNGSGAMNNPFLKGIRESPLFKNATITANGTYGDDLTEIQISKRVAGQKVSIHLEENGTSFSFQINDSYDKPKGLSAKDGYRIAKATEEMFSEIVNNMEVGSVITVYPYDGDGRGRKRRAYYERFGFGSSGYGSMYGEITWNGLEPSTYSALSSFRAEESFNFAESKVDRVKAMYVILWGEEPPKVRSKS